VEPSDFVTYRMSSVKSHQSEKPAHESGSWSTQEDTGLAVVAGLAVVVAGDGDGDGDGEGDGEGEDPDHGVQVLHDLAQYWARVLLPTV